MGCGVTYSKGHYPPVALVSANWLHDPLAPCHLLPNGTPGILHVVSQVGEKLVSVTYAVWVFGEPGKVSGYRLVRPDFTFHDVDVEAEGGPTCDCPDAISRVREGGCKHVAALRLVGEPIPQAIRNKEYEHV